MEHHKEQEQYCSTNETDTQEQQNSSKEHNKNDALEKCLQESAEWKDKFLRLSADFQNYKKRLEKDQLAVSRVVKADLLEDILNVVDNVERAFESSKIEGESIQTLMHGLDLIKKDLYKFLEKQGVKEIELYDEFNPELHEAVMQVESDTHEPGEIVEVLQKGYFLNREILRPAKVSVAQ